MNRILQTIFVMIVFLSLYLGLHSYVAIRMAGMLGIKKNLSFYLILLTLCISFILSTILVKNYNFFIFKGIYMASATWMGYLFLLFCTLLLFEIVNIFYQLPPFKTAITILVLVLIITLYSIINAHTLTVKQVPISIEGLEKEVRIVQLSDLHIGTINGNKYLERIVEKTNEQKADFVVITGDLVDGSAPLDRGMFDILNKITSDVYFITGNHETYEGEGEVLSLLKETKVRVLTDEQVTIKGINLLGVRYYQNKTEELRRVLQGMNLTNKKPNILLYHVPVKLEFLEEQKISLQLAGHTHGGQLFPFGILVRLANPYVKGLHSLHETNIYVSEGTGTWGPPMRFMTHNEITVIALKKK